MIKQRSSKGAAVTTSLFVVGKCLYVFALFLASDYLHNNWTHSLLSFTFILLLPAACIFLTLQKSWRLLIGILVGTAQQHAITGSKKESTGLLNGENKSAASSTSPISHSKQLFIVFLNGLAMMLIFTLFNIGLMKCGSIRAILMEFTDAFLLAIPTLMFGFSGIPTIKRRGLILVTLAVVILLFSQETGVHDQAHATTELSASNVATSAPDTLTASITNAPAPHSTLVLGVFEMSEGAIGMCSLLLAAALGSLRRSYEKLQSKDFGGRKRLHAVSMFVGAISLIPTMILLKFFEAASVIEEAASTTPAVVDTTAASTAASATIGLEEISTFSSLFTLLFLVLFYVVLQFYVEAIAQRATADSQLLIKVNLGVSFTFAALLDMWRGEARLTLPIVAAASILFFGVHFLVQAAKSKDSSTSGASLIPMYAATPNKQAVVGHGLTGFSLRELKMMFKHFMSDRTSMRIFMFLSINFLFMFVELIYGWYSNSLGLISDAGHMLFDCTALGIGLYASFVSKLKPNQLYTYGYGRYEIISGYVNAVFLLFIGYFIFVESVERLFSPPEITSDSLVLVSVLGLMVNMVGLFFFHDHGSHGHSHGGGAPCPMHEAKTAAAANDHGHSHGDAPCSSGHDHGSSGATKAASAAEAQRNSNMFAIYLHILADALGSVGVIISSLLVKYKGWTSADAICSIIISLLIVASVLPLIKSMLETLNQRTPVFKEPMIRDTLKRMTEELPGVLGYREAHFWTFSDTETIGTLHVHVSNETDEQKVLQQILDLFKESGIGVSNLSVQIEKDRFIQSIEAELKDKPYLTGGNL